MAELEYTCIHFANVSIVEVARSVPEAGRRNSNALDVLVRIAATPPAVGGRIVVQPVCRRGSRCRRLVQCEPEFSA